MRISDWSSDVCSSDLNRLQYLGDRAAAGNAPPHAGAKAGEAPDPLIARFAGRNETANRLTGRTRQRCGFENSSDRRRRLYRQPCRGRARRRVNGRASCRADVWPYVEYSGGAVSLKKKRKQTEHKE